MNTSVEPIPGAVPQELSSEKLKPREGLIDVAAWIDVIDTSFKQGDYETVNILRRIKPDLSPKPETVQKKASSLVSEKPSEWTKTFKEVRSSSSESFAENPAVEEGFGKLFEQFGQEEGVLNQLESYIEATGYTPTPEQIQAKYKSLINGRHSFQSYQWVQNELIRDVRKLTGVAPDSTAFQEAIRPGNVEKVTELASNFEVTITDEMVQTSYEHMFEVNGRIDPSFVEETGVAPSEDLVHRVYKKLIDSGNIEEVATLRQATGVEHQFTYEEVESIYSRYLGSSLHDRDAEKLQQIIEATGIKPDPRLVQQSALRILDSQWAKDDIERLERATGVQVQIPDEVIQEQYQKAMEKGKYRKVLRIHNALGVKPQVDAEEARLLMVERMDTIDAERMQKLEDVFKVDFHAKPDEIQAKYQQAFENLSFHKVDRISQITGQKPEQQQLQAAFERHVQERFTAQSSGYSRRDWTDDFREMEEKYGVKITNPLAQSLYEQALTERIDTGRIEKLNEMLGKQLSPELAQKAYATLLTGDGHSLGSTFEKVYELSGGTAPELPADQVQGFYLSRLSSHRVDTDSIQVISSMTGIEPRFDPKDIRQIYHQAIADGASYRIREVRDFTQVEFTLDDETRSVVERKLEDELTNMIEGDYDYGVFDKGRIKTLIEVTGIQPNAEAIQTFYGELLAKSDMSWSLKIDVIAEATGTQPSFTQEQISEKAENLINSGQTYDLKKLTEYGALELDEDVVLDGYDKLLDLVKDEYDHYGQDWLDEFQIVQAVTGINPTAKQFGEIASHLSSDSQYSGQSYYSALRSLEVIEETFGIKLTPQQINGLYTSLLKEGDFINIESLKKKTGVELDIPAESLQPVVDETFRGKKRQDLFEIKQVLGLETLPIGPELVQDEYAKLAESVDFGKWDREGSTKPFYELHKLTGVTPQLSPEQLSRGFRNAMASSIDGKFEYFANVVGVAPTEADLQSYLYTWLTGRENYSQYANDFIENNSLTVPTELVNKVVLENIGKASLGSFNKVAESTEWITELTGRRPEISLSDIESVMVDLAQKSTGLEYSSGADIVQMMNWLESQFDYTPSAEVVGLVYEKTWQSHISSREMTVSGLWEWLQGKYGPPSKDAAQSIYIQQLLAGPDFRLNSRSQEIQNFTGISPNVSDMQRLGELRGLLEDGVTASSKLQETYQELLMIGRVSALRDLQKRFGYTFQVGDSEAQILYAKLLMEEHEHQIEMYDFLVENTGVLPSNEIVQARYSELFTSEQFDQEKITHFHQSVGVAPSPELIKGALVDLLNVENIEIIDNIGNGFYLIREFGVTEEDLSQREKGDVDQAVDNLVAEIWNRRGEGGVINQDKIFLDCLKISETLNLSRASVKTEIAEKFGVKDEDFTGFVQDNSHFVALVLQDGEIRLTPGDIEKLSENYVIKDLISAELLKRNGFDFDRGFRTEDDYKTLFESLQGQHPEWVDDYTIVSPFARASEVFGYERMFTYVARKGLTLHDALHAYQDISGLHDASGLSASEFYGNILHQVAMDDREYYQGTAHHHFNSIAQSTSTEIAKVLQKARDYRDIEKLQELAASLESPQAVFSSWNSLKRYSKLEQLLGRTEVLDELKELKAEGKEELYQYIETLAFHPDSKVDMRAVFQFWRNPESFLGANASHTPKDVQDRKKPSNYIHMPNLDLTALELRDALVEGKMDGIQAFAPLEVRYTIPVEDYKPEPVLGVATKALGSRKRGVEGAARNPTKLFRELNDLLKPHGSNVVKYLQGNQLPEAVDISQIETLVYDDSFGMKKPQPKTRTFVARINRKSDPEGVMAGDDTANCMPFGDGKNTVYTFNPNTAQFVIRVVIGDGKERTIAQSVLTKDVDIKTPIPDVISQLEREGGHLEDVLPAEVLKTAPTYIAGDNVEVSPNFSDQRHQEIIEAIMRDYFREYMSRYAETQGLESSKMPIGQGYTDALSHLPKVRNTFAPQAPVSYSDKTGGSVYMLDLTSDEGSKLILDRTVKVPEALKTESKSTPHDMAGIDYLTYEDSLRVGYLEGKAYADNESLMQFLFNMENALIAKDINNAAKGRANMSLKYTDKDGQMRGYFLAWEGRLTDENVEYDAEEFFDQPCVYMLDIATDRENRMAGGRLIKAFTQLYKQNYLDQDNPLPIFAQARETTSFRIVQRQLERIGREAGVEFELIELPTYEVGEDTMHPIIIQPLISK